MVKVKNLNHATASAPSNSTSTNTNKPSSAANTASLLKSKDSNTLNDVNNDLLTQLNNNKTKLQNRASLSLQRHISAAVRPVKLNNLQTDYLNKLDQVQEENHKLSLSEVKALKFEKKLI
jgi:phosphoenolpyruvate synthase/pyruvate phosphate dikinase